MSYTQSPSRQSRRAPSRPPSVPALLVAPAPQYGYPLNLADINPPNVGASQANSFEQQSGYPQGHPTASAFFDQQTGHPTAWGQCAPPGMAQGASPSNRPRSTRYSPAPYPYAADNPGHKNHQTSPPSFPPIDALRQNPMVPPGMAQDASPSNRPRSTRHSPAPYSYVADNSGHKNHQTSPPSFPPIDALRQNPMASPRNPPPQPRTTTERTPNAPIPAPGEQTAKNTSDAPIEVFSPGTSRLQRHERERTVSTPRRRRHRHEDPQSLALSYGAQSTPPAQYHGSVGTSNVNIYHMYKPTFVYQDKKEDKAESGAATKKTSFLDRFKPNSDK